MGEPRSPFLVVLRRNGVVLTRTPDFRTAEDDYRLASTDSENIAAFLYDENGKLTEHFYAGD